MNALSSLRQPASRGPLARPLAPWARRMLGNPLFEALAAPHGVSRYLELVSPLWSLDTRRARVVEVRHETADTVTLVLEPPAHHGGFRAGQFVRLSVEVDGVRRSRCYSVSCSEHRPAPELEITVRAHAHGVVSRFLHEHAAPGLVVGLEPATGEFTLPTPRPDRLLLVSGGSGITPVMSMLRTLVDEGYAGEVTFLHYARSREDVPFVEELEHLAGQHPGLHLRTVFTRSAPGPHSHGLRGHFTHAHLPGGASGRPLPPAYVCGPPALIEAVRSSYVASGCGDRFHVESFLPPASNPEATDGEATGEIRFEPSGVSAPNDGRTLLEQAEAAGLSPEYGCRMGVCHSCTRRLVAGRVRHVQSGRVCSEPNTDVQLCVHAPVGDVTIDL